MGNLHAGHLSLVDVARKHADRVVVSIFVNPMQFGPSEDYESYPRTQADDLHALQEMDVEAAFAPPVATVYPHGHEQSTRIEVPRLTDILCGASRPGHFPGVATVVNKLINMALPDVAVFGEKDYQQLLVITRMVEDLSMPVEIVPGPTVREPDGLALSSRNAYLSADERQRAPLLYRTLCETCGRLGSGDAEHGIIEREAREALQAGGFRPEYFSIRRDVDLGEPDAGDQELRILAAAWLGKARLIDNIPCLLQV